MKISSVAAAMAGVMVGVGAAAAFGMLDRQNQKKLKKIADDAGRKVAEGLNHIM